jgi:hypothetical protein
MAQTFNVNLQDEFLIGMDDKYNGSDLPPGLFNLIQNGLVNTNNISKRTGTTGSNVVVASGVQLGGSAFEPSNGSKFQVVCLNGASNAQLYISSDGTTFSAIGSANLTNNAQMNFVQASDRLFGFNGTEVVDVANDGTTVTKNRSGVPIGKFGYWFHNFLFVAGVAGTSINNVYWSNLGDPTTFTGANFIAINANDGDYITGLSSFSAAPSTGNDFLIVAKLNSFWTIGGWSGTTFSANTIAGQNTSFINNGYGTPSHRCMIAVGKYFYYLSFIGGIPHIRALQKTIYGSILDSGIVSYDMEGTMSALNNTKLMNACAVSDGKFVYFSFPSSASQVNDITLVYYPELTKQTPLGEMHSWVKWTGFTPNTFLISTISGQAKIYFTDGGTTGKVFHFDPSVYTDNGTAIVLKIQTRDYFGHASKQAKYLYYYFKYGTGSAGTLTINARIDQATNFGLQETLDLSGTSPGLGPSGNFTLGTSKLGGSTITEHRTTLLALTGHLLGVQLIESTANACNIYDMQVYGVQKGYRSS